jgi:hypothetical protein
MQQCKIVPNKSLRDDCQLLPKIYATGASKSFPEEFQGTFVRRCKYFFGNNHKASPDTFLGNDLHMFQEQVLPETKNVVV